MLGITQFQSELMNVKSPENGQNRHSNLEQLIQAGKFVVTGELGPPKGWSRDEIERKAGLLRGVVDAVNILGTHFSETIRRYAHELLSRQDAKVRQEDGCTRLHCVAL